MDGPRGPRLAGRQAPSKDTTTCGTRRRRCCSLRVSIRARFIPCMPDSGGRFPELGCQLEGVKPFAPEGESRRFPRRGSFMRGPDRPPAGCDRLANRAAQASGLRRRPVMAWSSSNTRHDDRHGGLAKDSFAVMAAVHAGPDARWTRVTRRAPRGKGRSCATRRDSASSAADAGRGGGRS